MAGAMQGPWQGRPITRDNYATDTPATVVFEYVATFIIEETLGNLFEVLIEN
jgi:hypothetical protein